MFIADAHCDTLYKLAVDQIPLEACMVTPRRMQAGGVGLQTLAMFAGGKGCAGTPYADAVRMMEAAAYLKGKAYVTPRETEQVFVDVGIHRIRLGARARAGHVTGRQVLEEILNQVPRPVPKKQGGA